MTFERYWGQLASKAHDKREQKSLQGWMNMLSNKQGMRGKMGHPLRLGTLLNDKYCSTKLYHKMYVVDHTDRQMMFLAVQYTTNSRRLKNHFSSRVQQVMKTVSMPRAENGFSSYGPRSFIWRWACKCGPRKRWCHVLYVGRPRCPMWDICVWVCMWSGLLLPLHTLGLSMILA